MHKQLLAKLALSLALTMTGSSFLATTTMAAPAKMVEKLTKAFQKADKNKDGALTLAEAKAGTPSRLWKKFDKIDANKSGTITMEEIVKSLESGTVKR